MKYLLAFVLLFAGCATPVVHNHYYYPEAKPMPAPYHGIPEYTPVPYNENYMPLPYFIDGDSKLIIDQPVLHHAD